MRWRGSTDAVTMAGLRRAGPLLAAVWSVGVVVADILTGDRAILIGLLIVAPLIVSVTSAATTTALFAAVAIAATAASGIWNDSFGDWFLWVPLSVVISGSAASIGVAMLREQTARELGRMGMLAELAELAGGGGTVEQVARATSALLVPRLADACLFEVVGNDGELRPLDVGAGAGEVQAMASSFSVELRARERRVGVLTLGRGPARAPFQPADRRFLEVLAGRVGLALDNAGLSVQLTTAEQQLEAILREVDAAITVRDIHGRMVYANQAAADLLELPDIQAVKETPPAELMELFEVYDERGEPVALTDLPGSRVLAGEDRPEPVVVRNIVRATGEERWLVNKATGIRDEHGRVVMAINVIDDVTVTKRRETGQRLLAQALRALSGSLELEDMLQALADTAVPGLADWAGVDLLDERGDPRTVAVAHRDPGRVRIGWHLRRTWPVGRDDATGPAAVIRTGKPVLVPEVTDEALVAAAADEDHLAALRAIGVRSTMMVPMTAGEDVVGALTFVSSTARRFDEEDLGLAVDLGRQAGIAVRNAQLFTERREIAHTLQTGLLPGGLPDIVAWDLAAFYRPAGLANEAGGDFYDAVRTPGGWVLMIGDVAGKGAVAAALTAVARYTLRTAIQLTGDPHRALAHLNDVLLARDELSLCTVALLQIPDEAARIEVFVAGHPFPLHRSGAHVHAIGETGPMLGAFADAAWAPTRLVLAPDDTVVLYTDGIVDTVGADGRFGTRRLEAVVRDAGPTADEVVDTVRQATDSFCDGPQPDDVAVLAVRHVPVPARTG